VFEVAGLKKPDISVLSDDFLDGLRSAEHKNLAAELLRKLLHDELKTRRRKNVVQSEAFSEKLERTIARYHNRAIATVQVIEELIALAKEMNDAGRRGEDLGLTDDELAFYDALETNDSAVKVLGDKILKQIARELTETIRRSVTIDWTVKETVRAKLRTLVRRKLRQHGYPPDMTEKRRGDDLEAGRDCWPRSGQDRGERTTSACSSATEHLDELSCPNSWCIVSGLDDPFLILKRVHEELQILDGVDEAGAAALRRELFARPLDSLTAADLTRVQMRVAAARPAPARPRASYIERDYGAYLDAIPHGRALLETSKSWRAAATSSSSPGGASGCSSSASGSGRAASMRRLACAGARSPAWRRSAASMSSRWSVSS
jgi:hypothetical protein